ncbi:MAG: hypothetical protein V3T83_14420, partial [Acidobacteriota bacterium]
RDPVICRIDNTLLAAKSGAELDSKLQPLNSIADGYYDVIDGSGGGWSLNTEYMVVCPICFKKGCTKKEIIQMYNNSRCSEESGGKNSEKGLSAKRVDRIVVDVAKLISDANKKMQWT